MIRIVLITLGSPEQLTGGYLYHRRLAAAAERFDARLEFVSYPARPFPLAVLDSPTVIRNLRARSPDAVVIDSIAAAFLGPWLIWRRLEWPLIAILHQPPGGIDHNHVRTTVQAWLDRMTYNACDGILVASELLVDQMAASGFPRERVRVVPPGRDVAGGPPESSGELRQGRRLAILCVANWLPRKGILDLLEMMKRLPEDVATLHLVGDDQADLAYAMAIRRQLEQPAISGRVVVHGPLRLEQVAGMYEASDVFVLPSIREPFGTVYGEAMAAGLPVIGWRLGNLPFLATDGQEGLLLEPGDVEGLARALVRLAEDEAYRLALGAAAQRRAASRPTWDETAANFFDTVRSILTK